MKKYVDQSLEIAIAELLDEIQKFIKEEVALMKTEMHDKLMHTIKDAAFLIAGIVVLCTAFLALVGFLISGIGAVVALWLSALIVGLALAVIGYLLIRKGLKNLKKEDLVPHKTIASVKEIIHWMKEKS